MHRNIQHPFPLHNKPQSRWLRYWHYLTAPSSRIQSVSHYQQAELLLALIVIILPLAFCLTIGWAALSNQLNEILSRLMVFAFIPVSMAYLLGRTRYYYIGIYIFIGATILGISAIIILFGKDITERIVTLNFLAIAIVLASVLLAVRFALVIAGLCLSIIWILLFSWQVPIATVWNMTLFILFITILMTIGKVVRDNSARKQELTDALYRALFNQSHDGVFMLDLNGNHMAANQRAADMLGYTYEEIQRLSWRDLSAEIRATENTRDRLLRGEILPTFERKFRKKDGTIIPVEINAELVRFEENQSLYIQSVVRDISHRKAAEQALADSEARYRSIVTAMAEGIVLQDSQGIIVECNAAAEQILGLPKAQIIGLSLLDPILNTIHEDGSPFLPQEYPVHITLQTSIPQRNIIMGFYRPTGELVWVSINSQPLIHEGETQPYAVIASFTDITERKQMEDVIRRNQEQAFKTALEQERMRVMTNFVTDTSHEFRTPLTIINTSLHLIPRLTDEDKQQAQIAKAYNQIKRITHLIDMLLAMVKLDGGMLLRLETIHLNTLLKEVLDNLQPEIAQKQHNLVLNILPLPPVQGDADQLFTALRCLIDNAVRFTPPNGQITITTQAHQHDISIKIQDTGVGIVPEALPHIFERFWRQDTAHTTPGLGLGLSLTHKIIELHHGQIIITSQPNQGSAFTITLPIDQPEKSLPETYSSGTLTINKASSSADF